MLLSLRDCPHGHRASMLPALCCMCSPPADRCCWSHADAQDGIKLFTYSFYKQRRADVQVCGPCSMRYGHAQEYLHIKQQADHS